MVLFLAFSLQDQVEKYGAYVGLAAFIGLAVLSLLYFAQARELKRLRDWAGRAPERAQELEARVVAQAEEALSVDEEPEPEPAQPAAAPVPVSGNGKPSTPVAVPMGPRPAVAVAAARAAAAAPATVVAEPAEEPEPGVTEPDRAPEPVAGAATVAPEPVAPAEVAEPEEALEEAKEPAQSGNGVPAKPPTEIPRATPRPQPKPVPAAAPLRASTTRSTTLPPARRTPRPAERGGSRTGLYTFIGIVVLAIAIFVPIYFTLLSGDDAEPPPNRTAEPGGTTPTSQAGAGEAAAEVRPDKVVVVLNGTSADGLASQQRDKLMAAGYVDEMIRIDNSDDQQRQDSLILYAADERRQARDVARLLDISRLEEIDPETEALANSSDETGTLPADVVAVIGADKSP
jgi:hypothetical protein